MTSDSDWKVKMWILANYDKICIRASFNDTNLGYVTTHKDYYHFILYFQLNIWVLPVEYVHGKKSNKKCERFMSEKGYRVHGTSIYLYPK